MPPALGHAPEHHGKGIGQQLQRRGEHHEQDVLQHVYEEQTRCQCIEGRQEGQAQESQACQIQGQVSVPRVPRQAASMQALPANDIGAAQQSQDQETLGTPVTQGQHCPQCCIHARLPLEAVKPGIALCQAGPMCGVLPVLQQALTLRPTTAQNSPQ